LRRLWLALLLPAAAFGQLEEVPPASIQVPVWTAPGESISAESLSASIDGTAAKIVDVHSPQDDLMLLVVLDLTDDLAAVEQARGALIDRINALPPNCFVGVLQDQNSLSVLAEPSPDRLVAANAIRSHPVGGRAGLLNTIEAAARIGSAVISRSGVRLAVLYLTDSDIRNYRENYQNSVVNSSDNGDLSRQNSDTLVRERISRMVTALAETQVPVFISQLSYRTDQLNVAYQTGLITLAGATGGSATISRSIAEIPSAIDKLLDRILAQYTVRVVLPAVHENEIELTLETAQGNSLTYRTEYVLE
jgi:hypothetical protein